MATTPVIPEGFAPVVPEGFQPVESEAPRIPEGFSVAGMEKLGALPPPPRPPLPAGIIEQPLASGSFQNPRTGRTSQGAPLNPYNPLDAPVLGVQQVARGTEELAAPAQALGQDILRNQRLPGQPTTPPALTPALIKQGLGAASEIMSGGFKIAAPLIPAGFVAAPAATAGALLRGTVASLGTEAALRATGAPKEVSGFAGNLAAILAGGELGRKAFNTIWEAAGNPTVEFGKIPTVKEFADMTDAELTAHYNKIEQTRPKNYEWQRQEIAKEVLKRSAGKGMPAGTPPEQPPAAPAPAPPPAPPPTQEGLPLEPTLPEPDRGTQFQAPEGPATVRGMMNGNVYARVETPEGPQTISMPLAEYHGLIAQKPTAPTPPLPEAPPAAVAPTAEVVPAPTPPPPEPQPEVLRGPPPLGEKEPDVSGGRRAVVLDPADMDPATRAEYGHFLNLLDTEGDRLGFDRRSQAVSAILMHNDWAQRWDIHDPELIRLGNKFGGWEQGLPTPEPAALPSPAPETAPERSPGWVGNIPTSEINVDAPRFQFKQNVGEGGAGEELRSVQKWDPEKAGILAVWQDPADGKTYVVNGHNRVRLAQRTEAPEMTVRYLQADNAQEARTKGALINIAEGRGESTDAAKVFREGGISPEELANQGVSLKGKIASEGMALSKLAQPIFDDVMSGALSPARGAVIGAGLENPADQQALYDMIRQDEKAGKRPTNDQVAEMIELAKGAPKRTETQEDLFGTEETTRSLLREKAEVSDYVRKQLGQEKKLFGTVASQAAAEKLAEQGNVMQTGANAQVAQAANQGMAVYDKLKAGAGPIGNILNRAAESLADGESAAEVKQRAYRAIRTELKSQVEKLTRGQGGGGNEGLGAARPDREHPVSDQPQALASAAPSESTQDIIRGSTNIPLAPQGEAEATDLAKRTAGQFSEIWTSPLERAKQTTAEVAATNPQAGKPISVHALTPWFLGGFEGKPTLQVLDDLHDLIRNHPSKVPPGRGPNSTSDGQSWNDYRNDFLGHVDRRLDDWQEGEKILSMTHYRGTRLLQAWHAAGMPADRHIDLDVMTSKGDVEPGEMLRLYPPTGELTKVTDANQSGGGLYFARHGATAYNAENRAATSIQEAEEGPQPLMSMEQPQARSIPEIQKALQQGIRKTIGSVPLSAPPAKKLARVMELSRREITAQLQRPVTGADWYGKDTALADQDLGRVFPELNTDYVKYRIQKMMSAAISPSSNPQAEAYYGAEIYNGYRETGKIPTRQPSGQAWPPGINTPALEKLQSLIDMMGEQGLADFLTDYHDRSAIWQIGKSLGSDASTVNRWLEGRQNVPGSSVLGSKVSRYFASIAGMPDDGTAVDIWIARAHYRQLGHLNVNGQPVEVPLSQADRHVFMQAHNSLALEFGLTPQQIQSVLWHSEKELYRTMGSNTKTHKRSDGTLRYLEQRGLDPDYVAQRRSAQTGVSPGGTPVPSPSAGPQPNVAGTAGAGRPTQTTASPAAVASALPGDQDLFAPEEDGVPVEGVSKEKLLGEQLTAQMKSGGPAKAPKIKPAKNRGLFEEEGPEQESLFARRRAASPDQLSLFDERSTTVDSLEAAPASRTYHLDPTTIRRLNDPPSGEGYYEDTDIYSRNIGGHGAVFVNGPAMDIILQSMGPTGQMGNANRIMGIALTPGEWMRVLYNARQAAADPRGSAFEKGLLKVADEIRNAKSIKQPLASMPEFETKEYREAIEAGMPRGPLIVVQAGKRMSDYYLKRTAEEELDHANQMTVPGGLHGLPVKIIESGLGQKAVKGMVEIAKYKPLNPQSPFYVHNRAVMAAEVLARLMRPGRYRELGLEPQEARDLAEQFAKGLAVHGEQAGAIVDQIYEAIEKNLPTWKKGLAVREAPNQAGRQGSATGVRGPPAGTEPAVSGDQPQPLASLAQLPHVPTSPELIEQERAAAKSAIEAVYDALFDDSDNHFGEKLRTMVTGNRDVRLAEANQIRGQIQRILPNHVDREALTLVRDFKNRPGELQQFRAEVGTLLPKELGPVIDRALNPTPGIAQADQIMTDYFTKTLDEGRKLGFLDSGITNDEYITHVLQPREYADRDPNLIPRAMGRGRIGPRNFANARSRYYPTVLHAMAAGVDPRTLDAVDALTVYADRYAKTAAYRILVKTLQDSALGVWGTRSAQKAGKLDPSWVEMYPESQLFRRELSFINQKGEAQTANQMFMVPSIIATAMRPALDPNYMSRVPAFMSFRMYQAYLKSIELGMSVFHLRALGMSALNNQGINNVVRSVYLDLESPEFKNQELSFVRAGGNTPVLGRTIEAYLALKPSSVPNIAQRIGRLPVIKQLDHFAAAISKLTFDIAQRKFKVMDFSLQDAAWIAKHQAATPEEHFEAQRNIAKEVNAVYGGLHWENMGVHRVALELSRALLLAPDWFFSNYLNAKYATEGAFRGVREIGLAVRHPSEAGEHFRQAGQEFRGGPGEQAARLFWIKSAIYGVALGYGLSLLLSGRTPKDPTQVLIGKNHLGQDVYSNMFFVGAPGDLVTLTKQVERFGAVVGFARFLVSKFGPAAKASMNIAFNENERRQPVVKESDKFLKKTVKGALEVARETTPAPFTVSSIMKMLLDKKHHYTAEEYIATAITGRQPLPLPKKKGRR